jgi:hypothetical protein
MSFDVFVQCYGDTITSGLSRNQIRALFPVVEEKSEPGCWVVEYDATNQSDIYVEANERNLNHFMVSRPCGDVRLWAALLAVLRMGQAVMFWPGSPPLIASGGSAAGLPEGMLEGLGQPVFVDSAEEFLELLKTT